MEGGGAAGGATGGGGLYAAREPRERRRQVEELEEKDGGQQPRTTEGGAGGMKFRVSARTPHGVGALLLIGGAVLAGAAVVAWRHARRGRRPAKREEVADGGVVQDGKGGASALETDQPDAKVQGGASARETDRPDDNVQGGASPREIDRSDDKVRGEEEEKTEIGSNGLDNGMVTDEIQEVHDDDAEIVAEGLLQNSERIENIDFDLRKSSTEISMHDDDVDSEHVEEYDKNSSTKLSEMTIHAMDTATVEKVDENSTKEGTENDDSSTENDTDNDRDSIANHTENEDPSKNELEKQTAPNDNKEVEASRSISRPGIVLDEQSLRSDGGAQEAESMENSPTAKLMMHQEQPSDDTTTDTEGEAAEAKPEKETILGRDAPPKQAQQKVAVAEPVGLADSPPGLSSSLVKPTTEKKEPELPGRIETGMKMEQDYTNGVLKEHALNDKGGGAVMTMDRRSSSSMAILALMLALTIGIAIVVRLYAPPRATELQMDLQ